MIPNVCSGLKVQLTFSCYVIRHGDDYLVWDAGNPIGTTPTAPKVSLVDMLAQAKVTPAQVKYVAISRYQGDHVGQVSTFPAGNAAHWQGRLGCVDRSKDGGDGEPRSLRTLNQRWWKSRATRR